jgi:hypothetical protein
MERLKIIAIHAILAALTLCFARLTIFSGWAVFFTLISCINMALIIYHITKKKIKTEAKKRAANYMKLKRK